MPLSHTCTDGATGNRDHLDQILSDLGTESRRLSERAPAEQDFERFEGELHELFAAAERVLLAHELEQLDVDRPAVTIAGQRHHRVLRSTATYTSAVGPVTVLRTLYRAGCEAGSGSAGVAGGHHRGPLDAAGGAPSELSGGSSDAPGGGRYAARVRQHESLEEQLGPAPEAAEQPLGGAPCRVRGGVWRDNQDEKRATIRMRIDVATRPRVT